MEAKLIAYSSSSSISLAASLRRKVIVLGSWKVLGSNSSYKSSKIHHWQSPMVFSLVKTRATGENSQRKSHTGYLDNLVDSLVEILPKSLKEFPWMEAKYVVLDRLFFLATQAAKWFFIGLFSVSFLSDVSLALSRDRELLIPVGLFIGVALADFLREFTREFFHSSIKSGEFDKNLFGVGSIFVLVKLISLFFKLQTKVLLSHIGYGGLMQVLWLAKQLQQNEDIKNQEQTVDSSE